MAARVGSIALWILVPSSTAVAGDADLDTSFGDGGIVTFDGSASGVSARADGTLVVAGSRATDGGHGRDVLVMRFDEHGAPDPTFGDTGVVTTDVAESTRPGWPDRDGANTVATQADGAIIVAGSTGYDFDDAIGDEDALLVRYRADGSLDPSFDGDGIVTTEVTPQSADVITSMVVRPDGKIVGAGMTLPDAIGVGELVGVYADILLVRYHSDGSLDPTFGSNGIVTTRLGADSWDAAHAVALQPDGRIVVAGEAQADLLLARYDEDGSLDPTFGRDGLATIADASARAVAVQADGKIVVAGARDLIGGDVLLARFEADGAPDPTFGEGGVTVTSIGEPSRGHTIVLLPDGTIVVGGSRGEQLFGADRVQLLLRYDEHGALDRTFGTDGTVVTPVRPDRWSGAASAALQADGKLVVADFSGALVRYGTATGLVPQFEAPSSTRDGFRARIVNYDGSYEWGSSATSGTASIDEVGVVTVRGLQPGSAAVVTVTTSRPGFEDASAEISGSSLPLTLPATGRGTVAGLAAVTVALGVTMVIATARRLRR